MFLKTQICLVLVLILHALSFAPGQPQPTPLAMPLNESPPIAGAAAPKAITDQSLQGHAQRLRKKYGDFGFTVLVERPFIVLGDEAREIVEARAKNTVRWAVKKLKQDFFARDPDKIIDVWLFKDDVSYRKCLKEFFKEEPFTPFGFYSSHHRCLFMNIATGGGTLVHEIVHPFMEANFPGCPAWFNEGMGSLFEQSGESGGRIRGYTNWRLPSLQKAIKNKTSAKLQEVISMSNTEFYREDRGTNYAQARYLCYYLQEKGLLIQFYKEFLAQRRNDPTGFRTLQAVLGEPDMDAFQGRWHTFVLGLEFR